MQYIRALKASPGFDTNLTHCIYGLDADLMMLALTTHEPNFCLLREEVLLKESKHSRKDIFQVSQFHFLSITLLREYLAVEFRALLKQRQDVDVERVIDDFVFMCFLIGNDFLPNVPTVDISSGGIDSLFATYAKVVPQLDGYLTDSGRLVLPNVEAYLKALGDSEVEPEFCMDDIGDVLDQVK
jgi:5'-3' exoribonuclease 1